MATLRARDCNACVVALNWLVNMDAELCNQPRVDIVARGRANHRRRGPSKTSGGYWPRILGERPARLL
eukprot:2204271-Pyramimonas_sp.AAC.1